MCSHKSWFVTYEEKSSGNVLMGNNAPCKSVGIGSAQIRVHNGIVRTLIEVLHVLELKKNLVFVGSMDSKGFSYWVEGEVMQIRGKGKFVVMQGTKEGNMYILQGPAMIGSISTVSQVGNHASNNNSLWHLRLGHMSEKKTGNSEQVRLTWKS